MPDKKHDKTKIVQIWGEILDEGFTSVPNILLRYRSRIGLKPKHIMLIIDIRPQKKPIIQQPEVTISMGITTSDSMSAL